MNPLRTLVVDDEPLARARLQRLLGEFPKDVQCVGVLECADHLAEECIRLDVQLVFLDIRMPGTNVFTAIQEILPPRPQIVFVTAHEVHAVDAFRVEATDYVVKPTSHEAVANAVRRAKTRASQEIRSAIVDQRIAVPIGHRVRMISLGDIHHVRAQANYVEILTNRGTVLARMTMDRARQLLPDPLFLRVHRSWILRTDRVIGLQPAGSGRYQITLTGGVRVTSGRTYLPAIRAHLLAD